MHDIDRLLERAAAGEGHASDELWQLVYDEIHGLAQARMARLPPGQTLQPTALVHEVFLRLNARPDQRWDGAAHFYGAVARAMRNVLINAADRSGRARKATRTGGLEALEDPARALSLDNVMVVDEALEHLGSSQPRVKEVVLLRFFAGLTIPEIASALSVSHATVERDWAFARAWLSRSLAPAS